MAALGFTKMWPSGNPTEPWWNHEELEITFFKAPSAGELIERLLQTGRDDGIEAIRKPILEALGLG